MDNIGGEDSVDNDEYDSEDNLIKISHIKKMLIIDKVKLLEETLREEIYKLVIEDTIKYTEKSDGIIVNLNNLSEKCIVNIYNYIKYNEENKVILEK